MEHRGFGGRDPALYDMTVAAAWHDAFVKPIECTTPRANPHVNYGLWAMMCQCRVINNNKGTVWWETMMLEAVRVWGQAIHELSVFFTQFCYETKTALKMSFKNCTAKIWKDCC